MKIKIIGQTEQPPPQNIPMEDMPVGTIARVISASNNAVHWIGDIVIRPWEYEESELYSNEYINISKGEFVHSEYPGDDESHIFVKLLDPGEIVQVELTQEAIPETE